MDDTISTGAVAGVVRLVYRLENPTVNGAGAHFAMAVAPRGVAPDHEELAWSAVSFRVPPSSSMEIGIGVLANGGKVGVESGHRISAWPGDGSRRPSLLTSALSFGAVDGTDLGASVFLTRRLLGRTGGGPLVAMRYVERVSAAPGVGVDVLLRFTPAADPVDGDDSAARVGVTFDPDEPHLLAANFGISRAGIDEAVILSESLPYKRGS